MPRNIEPRLPPRERLLLAAETLFCQDGILRVTVDAIAEKAGSTKMTLYRHFASKEVLVMEWIKLLTEDYAAIFNDLQARFPDQPIQQIMGFVQFITDNVNATLHRGCPFTNTLAEAGEHFPDVRTIIVEHKQRQFHRLETLCQQSGAAEPESLAKEITLLLEGVQIVAQNTGFSDAATFTATCIEQRLMNLNSSQDKPR
ncbi:TetR/AcrR family transcriptional regulator [Erwinia sp. HDF1-3R]|uniref:TetR/AcrR family transcriptional regulator n=1 Tax=Erwinia sp. HDF1-3R TaxID=3141543 RepID=UPI0031F4AC51